MKHQQSQGSSNKPNAWSKPLQSKKGGGAINTDTPSTPPSDLPHRGGGKAPPGFTKQSSELTVANLAALRERYLHLLLTLTGQKVTVTLQSGVQYTGVLHTATPFAHLPVNQRHKYVLKAVSVVTGEDSTVKPGQTVLLDMEKVVQLHVKSCRLDALVSSSSSSSGNHTATTITPEAFTDMEISGGAGTAATRSKELVQAGTAWTSAGEIPVNSRAAKLAGTNSNAGVGALKGSIAGWDQFKANEELFNVIGTYDETVYTTVLDHTQISAQARQRAELLAREIEGTASTNLHIAEERGQALNQDYDEEDRYSGVLKVPAKPKLNYAQAVVAKTDTVPPGFGGEANETLAVDDTTTEEPKPAKAGIKPAKVECKPGKVALKPAKVESNPAKEEFKPAKGVSKPATEESKPVIEESKPTGKKIVETDTESKKEEVNTTENLVVVKADELANPEPDESGEDNKSAETSKSKLNASAKSFSFNINAKTFTPGVTAQQPPPPPPPPPQYIDPVTGMPIPMMQMTHGGPVMSGKSARSSLFISTLS